MQRSGTDEQPNGDLKQTENWQRLEQFEVRDKLPVPAYLSVKPNSRHCGSQMNEIAQR